MLIENEIYVLLIKEKAKIKVYTVLGNRVRKKVLIIETEIAKDILEINSLLLEMKSSLLSFEKEEILDIILTSAILALLLDKIFAREIERQGILKINIAAKEIG